jgi:hypothetical protein
MKKYALIALILIGGMQVFGQDGTKSDESLKKFNSGITLFNDFWKGDYTNMTPRGINQGIDLFGMYNIPMEHTKLLFSVGAGIGVHNLYTNAFLVANDSTGVYSFEKFSEYDSVGLSYKKYKISVAYMDFPFEFRYKASNGFKAALGMKFGFVVGSHTKYKGDNYLTDDPATLKLKTQNIKNLEKWRYGITAKLGYKAAEIYCYYGLSRLFRKDKGPDLYPISIGVSLRPF